MLEHHLFLLQQFRGESASQLHSLNAMVPQQWLMTGSKYCRSLGRCTNQKCEGWFRWDCLAVSRAVKIPLK